MHESVSNTVLRRATRSAAALLVLLTACRPPASTSWQGYVEGEFVSVAAPLPGRLETVSVRRGDRVETGAPLFTLESESERASQREAAQKVRQLAAKVEDLRKGVRPSELDALQARLEQTKALTELSSRQLERTTKLVQGRAAADEDLDRARLGHEANLKQISEIEAQLATARLGGRTDQIQSAEAELSSAQAALERAEWNVKQKTQQSKVAGLVYDRLFEPGEYLPAGSPAVVLLPPENLRIRFFVPEAEFASVRAGDAVQVSITGLKERIPAKISFLSPKPEYTPPVLYNRENRSKLVFLVEAVPVDAAVAKDLHPGQPVDVSR